MTNKLLRRRGRSHRRKMQEVRQKYDTPHTINRKSYARLEEQMQKELKTKEEIHRVELWKVGHKQKEGNEPNPGYGADVGSSVTDDLLAKALGEDKPDRLRGIGYGATQTKMVVKSHYKKIIKECQVNMMEMNERLALLEERSSKCVCCNDGSQLHRASPNSGNASNNHVVPSTSRTVPHNVVGSTSRTVPHHENESPISRPRVEEVLGKGKACKLLSWYNKDEIVADAVIVETYPKGKCHGDPIGFGAYKVTVTTSHVDDAVLFRQTSVLKRVLDVVGTYTTWGKDLILPV
ncbi:hypothetical protein MKW94_012122 [Papaver nudicaule]|uniref:Uncharacterized protein n=1 Tax=Papaver nudicaule TaxID=74823 RepID=A0AA42B199_PAPNU|nr:hypothetical protein [Papaver nudicaule]